MLNISTRRNCDAYRLFSAGIGVPSGVRLLKIISPDPEAVLATAGLKTPIMLSEMVAPIQLIHCYSPKLPARAKGSYSDQYKEEALELWRATGRSAANVAAELGICPPPLYRWARAERVPMRQRERNLLQLHQDALRSCLSQPNQL